MISFLETESLRVPELLLDGGVGVRRALALPQLLESLMSIDDFLKLCQCKGLLHHNRKSRTCS